MDQLMPSDRPVDPTQPAGAGPGSYGRMTPPNSMTPPPNQMVPPGYGSINPMPGGGMYAPGRPQRAPGHLSVVQMKLLSAQIKAYRYLARNLAMPEQLRTVILSHASNTTSSLPARSSLSPTPQPVRDSNATPPLSTYQTPVVSKQSEMGTSPVPSTATTPPVTTPNSNQQKPSPSVTPSLPTSTTSSTTTPSVKPESTTATSTKGQTQLKPVKLAPVTLPKGVDPELIQKEREYRIRARIIHRVNELESLPYGLPDELQRKAVIELKSLRLLDFQRRVGARQIMYTFS